MILRSTDYADLAAPESRAGDYLDLVREPRRRPSCFGVSWRGIQVPVVTVPTLGTEATCDHLSSATSVTVSALCEKRQLEAVKNPVQRDIGLEWLRSCPQPRSPRRVYTCCLDSVRSNFTQCTAHNEGRVALRRERSTFPPSSLSSCATLARCGDPWFFVNAVSAATMPFYITTTALGLVS